MIHMVNFGAFSPEIPQLKFSLLIDFPENILAHLVILFSFSP